MLLRVKHKLVLFGK